MDDDGSSILGFPRSAGQERLSGIIIPFILLNFFSQHLSLSFIHQTNNVLFYHNPFAYPTCTDTLVFYLSSSPETSHGKQLEKMNLQSYWPVQLNDCLFGNRIEPTKWNIVDWFGTWTWDNDNDDDGPNYTHSTRGGAVPRYCREMDGRKTRTKQAPKAQKGDRGIMVRGRMGGGIRSGSNRLMNDEEEQFVRLTRQPESNFFRRLTRIHFPAAAVNIN